MTKKAVTILLIMAGMSVSGCSSFISETAPISPIKFYRYRGTDLKHIGRVIFLHMDNETLNPKLASDLTVTIAEELQKKNVFGLETLGPSSAHWQRLDLGGQKEYSKEQLTDLKFKLNADAVMYGQVLGSSPYPQKSIAVNLKLVDCTTGQLLWQIRQVFDSTDAEIEARIKAFYKTQRSGYVPMDWKMVTVSPRMYNKFVAHEIAKTIY